MLKSPEEYFSSLSFDAQEFGAHELDASERAFVEKYIGSDALAGIPVLNPEPEPLPLPMPAPEPEPLPERPLVVAQPRLEVAAPALDLAPEIVVAPVKEEAVKLAEVEGEASTLEKVEEQIVEAAPVACAHDIVQKAPVLAEEAAIVDEQAIAAAAAPAQAAQAETVEEKPELLLRDKLRQASEVQVVSFFVSGQLFLLPVAGIQEVLRHMELVKVPQAPPFVAGAINLRGTVMPLIHLSALLTNAAEWIYDERSFVIVTGSPGMQMGLIIDKVSSMHMIPQKKIIWNAESKLGDAAEFLSAIVDLDDKVCGMIAPESITQKLFNEF